jgi:L-2,4-diaminobutyrate decarboxylase
MSSAAERIRLLYDPQLFEQLAQRWTATLSQHLARVMAGEGPVLPWVPPPDNLQRAGEILRAGTVPESASALSDRFAELLRLPLERGHNLLHPRYLGHQVPAPIPLAGLFQSLGTVLNHVMAIYEMGPWATAVERALVELWGERVGLQPGTFAGLVTNGGSLANLTALLTARNVVFPEVWQQGFARNQPLPVLLVQADAHYCIARSAGILGLGTQQIIKVPLDARRRMDISALRQLLEEQQVRGVPVLAVVATAGATPIGAFDPLEPIADLCEEFSVWLHVDAAHGGAVAFSEKYKPLLAGLERADSFICDAHKTLFVPALCAFVFYKNREHRFEAFRQEAPYLFDPSAPGMAEFDSGMLTVECTKQALTYGLWGLIATCGAGVLGDVIESTFDLTRTFYELLQAAPDFVPLHEPQCNILTFRYVPERAREWSLTEVGELNRRIRRELLESGRFYIVQTNLNGAGALRCCLMNPLTTPSEVADLLESIRLADKRISAESWPVGCVVTHSAKTHS